MALLIASAPVYEEVSGSSRRRALTVTLDSSYPSGGYAFAAGRLGWRQIYGIRVLSVNGPNSAIYDLKYDYANSKILVTQNEPPASLIVEESVTITSNAGRLANIPAYILAVHQSAGGTTGAAKVVPATPALGLGTKQCAVNFSTGALSFFATDAVTTALVTYIPMGVGPFVPANQVVDEVVTLGNGATVNLANRAALIQYVYNNSAGTAAAASMQIIGSTNAPSSGQIYPQLNNSGNTSLLDNAAQNTNSARVTYWKFAPFAAYGATADASVNTTSNAILYTTVLSVPGILIPAYGVQHAAYATNTDTVETALGPSGAVAANVCVINPAINKISFNAGDSITREQFGFIVMNPQQLVGAPGQVAAGQNLASITARIEFHGRP